MECLSLWPLFSQNLTYFGFSTDLPCYEFKIKINLGYYWSTSYIRVNKKPASTRSSIIPIKIICPFFPPIVKLMKVNQLKDKNPEDIQWLNLTRLPSFALKSKLYWKLKKKISNVELKNSEFRTSFLFGDRTSNIRTWSNIVVFNFNFFLYY